MRRAAPATTPTDFFISYTQADEDWAAWIAWQLEDAGYRTLIQAWDFAAGGNFVGEMQRALQTAARTIAVLSDEYLAAPFPHAEWTAAFAQDPTAEAGRLLPVRVAACRPDGLLGPVVYIDLVGLDEATARTKLLTEVYRGRRKPATPPGFPGPARATSGGAATTPSPPAFPGSAENPLRALQQAVVAGGELPELAEAALREIGAHSPRTLAEYRLGRIAEWSQPRHALNKRFTRLTLLLDQGQDAQGVRWQAQAQSFDDLRQVLAAAVDAPALVVLGPPGCGKSTLLRRLELDLACAALRAGGGEGEPQGTTSADADADADESVITFFVPLNRYRPANPGAALPLPGDWLTAEWARRTPDLPALADILRGRRLLLLLDAVNEIPHSDAADYRARIALWRRFLAELPAGTRAVFSCRSLDYSAVLSSKEIPVPQVRIEQLADRQVEDFLSLYSPQYGADLWRKLRGTPQLDLFRSPYYLLLLIAQAGRDGALLPGRAALFTGFVRQAVEREVSGENRLFAPGTLLDERDHERIAQNNWRGALDLPTRGPLLRELARFAFELQARRSPEESSCVRVAWDKALEVLATPCAADLLRAGVALQVLDEQVDDVYFHHQLLQEYFAARALTAHPQPGLVAGEWRADRVSPSLSEVLADLGDADPLPALPGSGWEETFVLAAALAPRADDFVAAVGAVNLPLAGRCAAQPDVAVSE
ncbi:MAG TPA: TIR domain-containing protein, partial [Plasticicumulans sp.]|nr:TIR domain-containing protein [Plasticicumulans sp.]